MGKLKDMHLEPTNPPLAFFITVHTYGTRLHGAGKGSVDRRHNVYGTPVLEANDAKVRSAQERMRHAPTVFDAKSAAIVERTIEEVCSYRQWRLWEKSVRSTHFHVIVTAPFTAERVMNDLKVWGTRRLREAGLAGATQVVWSQHGSTPHLYTEEELLGAIDYVKNGQGPPLTR